jgi:hypothetical protein
VVAESREMITLAVAAITEVIKFIGDPGPEGELTTAACWTGIGRDEMASRGGRTRRYRLEGFRQGLATNLMRAGGGIFEGVPITRSL